MTVNLPDARPTAEKNAELVRQMFDRVAPKYDLGNTVLSMGSDQHWRRVLVNTINPKRGMRILDVATGTAPLARLLAQTGADVVGLDFSQGMLAAGAKQDAAKGLAPLKLVNGDGNRLPFADNQFDALTIAFGLRNFPDPKGALREFSRVVRPGGLVCVLEFSTPTNWLFNRIYTDYLVAALPALAQVFTSDPHAYSYLADSILAWPHQRDLARWFAEAGLNQPRWQNLSGGIVALHVGEGAC
ncbi:class I SAM-dependent methyltransferase [Stomatohabitans albus]|uniref:class I SAM-dependent methyltransferase n=1 Tax=Stomatohabitans albus TaxID=3110766 RepID=UPI00300CD475